MSHELRTFPLHAILATPTWCRRHPAGIVPHEAAVHDATSGRYLLSLINDCSTCGRRTMPAFIELTEA